MSRPITHQQLAWPWVLIALTPPARGINSPRTAHLVRRPGGWYICLAGLRSADGDELPGHIEGPFADGRAAVDRARRWCGHPLIQTPRPSQCRMCQTWIGAAPVCDVCGDGQTLQ
jgi:hypothetical protein